MPSNHGSSSRRRIELPVYNTSSPREVYQASLVADTSRQQGDRNQSAPTTLQSASRTQNQNNRNHYGESSSQGSARHRPADHGHSSQSDTVSEYITAASPHSTQPGSKKHSNDKSNKSMLQDWSIRPRTHELRPLGLPFKSQDVTQHIHKVERLFADEHEGSNSERRR